MRTILTIAFCSVLFAACNNEPANQTPTTGDTIVAESPAATTDTSLVGCYAYITQRDTITMQLNMKGGSLSGPLTYKISEKDRNDGTFTGDVNRDLISGWYLFRSEGVMSVREVIWKKNNNRLMPAIGDMISRGDTMRFRDPANLTYDSTTALTRIQCII